MLIINARINTMEDCLTIENGYIEINNKIITRIGKMDECNITDDEVIDLKGSNIYPGFVDAHTHLGMWEDSLSFEGDDGNEETDPITPNLRAIDAVNPFDKCFNEALMAGVTTVVTGPGSANPIAGQIVAIKTYGKRIDNMIVKSPVALKMALGENPKSMYNDKNQTPMTRMAICALIREELYKAKRYIEDKQKAMDEDEQLPDFDLKLESLAMAVKREIPVHFHAHRADDIFTAIRIAKEFNLKFSIIHATEAGLISRELKGEGVQLMCGPFLTDRCKPEMKELDTITPAKLEKEGIDISIITDHPVTPLKYILIPVALAVRDGMDREEAIKSITINPAKMCGIDDKVGSIKVGKDADLVAFKGDILSTQNRPKLIIAGGKTVYRNLIDFN